MRVTFIGIHPDDIELACGGTVALCCRRGDDVTMVDLTRGECSSNGTPDERAAEAATAAGILGCSTRLNAELPDGAVLSEDPEQQRAVVSLLRHLRPEVALIPTSDDPHPDHASGGVLIRRALYSAGISGYKGGGDGEVPWKVPTVLVYSGRNEVRPDVVVDVTATMEAKRKAIRAHRTQFQVSDARTATPLNRPGFLELVQARDRRHGHLINVEFGEGFATLAPLALDGFDIFAKGR